MNESIIVLLAIIVAFAVPLFVVIICVYWWRRLKDEAVSSKTPVRNLAASLPAKQLKIVWNPDLKRWEVHNVETGKLAGYIKVKQGQKITWDPGGNNVTFFFSKCLFGALDKVTTSDLLTLEVSPDAPLGRNVYGVVVNGELAVGGTPPEMEVEEID